MTVGAGGDAPFCHSSLDSGVDLLGVTRRNWRFIAVITIAGCIATALLCRTLTPLYASTASVMLDPHEPRRAAVSADPNAFIPPSEETIRKNEIALIHSPAVAEQAITQLALERDPEFNASLQPPSRMRRLLQLCKDSVTRAAVQLGLANQTLPGDPIPTEHIHNQVIDRFLGRLTVTPAEASRVVDIRFLSEHPKRAEEIARAVAQIYIQQRSERDIDDTRSSVMRLRREIATVNIRIRDAESAIEARRQDNGLLPSENLKTLTDHLADLTRQLVSVTGERAALEARVAEVDAARLSKQVDTVTISSQTIQQLQATAAQASANLSRLAVSYPDEHPRMRQARAELNALHAQIASEIKRRDSSLRVDLTIAEAKEAMLRRMIADDKAEMAKSKVSDVDIRGAEREAEVNRNLLAQLIARLNQMDSDLDLQPAEAQVISVPTIPVKPTFPPILTIMAVGFLVSASGSTLAAVLRERLDGTIRNTAQLRSITAARILGIVPAITCRSWLTRPDPASEVLARPTSMFAEQLRALWLQLDRARKGPTVLVTSSIPNEGKSTIAMSLARLMAVSGRKVVIIDADLRCPTLHRKMGLRRSPGLTDLIAGTANIDEVIQLDRKSGALVVTAGSLAASPSDVLRSPKVSSIFMGLRTSFEAVIIDTPPVLAVPDASILVSHADLTALVVRWGMTKVGSVAAALQRLEDFGAQVGLVLTQVHLKTAGYYGYQDELMSWRTMQRYVVKLPAPDRKLLSRR